MRELKLFQVTLLGAALAVSTALGAGVSHGPGEDAVLASAPDNQTCPGCGHENKAGLNYCTMCGAALGERNAAETGETITCPGCGAEVPADSKFCKRCGSALTKKQPVPRGPRLGIGGYYVIGKPSGDLTASELDILGSTVDIDMENGIPFKMGLANFGAAVVFNIVRYFSVEGGVEMHTGYKNKAADVKVEWDIPPGEYYWRENEDNITWSLTNFYAGCRANIPTGSLIVPFGSCGFLVSLNSFKPEREWLGFPYSPKREIGATNIGLYFGGGTNFFVTEKVAIVVPLKYHLIFTGTYDYEESTQLPAHTEKWKPPAYLTIGGGVTFYPI